MVSPNSQPIRVSRDWMEAAACKNENTETFFNEDAASKALAKAVCKACVVQAECLDYALSFDDKYGVWGGLDSDERRNLMTRLHRQQAS